MREIFKSLNGENLREGEKCLERLTNEFQDNVTNVPIEVIAFYAKICVFFKMRHLNLSSLILPRKSRDNVEERLKRWLN